MVLCPSDANALCVQRTYDFIEVCGWFAARCDLILLLFDPAKLDISDEMKQVCALSPPTVLDIKSTQALHAAFCHSESGKGRGHGLAHKHVAETCCWH